MDTGEKQAIEPTLAQRSGQGAADSAIQAHLLETLRQQNERLQLLSDAAAYLLTNSDPNQVVQGMFACVADHLGLDTYFNYMVAEEGQRLHLDFCTGVSEQTQRAIEWLEFRQAICGTVAQMRQSIVAEHIQTSDYEKAALVRGLGIRAYCCHPLMVGDRLIGTLSFASHIRDTFTVDEVDFLRTLCHYVAMAKERIRLTESAKQRAEQLEESEQRLNLALRSARMVAWDWDVLHDKITTSDTFPAVYGLSSLEASAQGFSLVYPEDRQRHQATVQQAVATGSDYLSVFRIIRPDTGQIAWIEERGHAICDVLGKCVKLTGVSQDVTEQKQSEQEIHSLKDHLQARLHEFEVVLETIPVAIFLADDPDCQYIRPANALARSWPCAAESQCLHERAARGQGSTVSHGTGWL